MRPLLSAAAESWGIVAVFGLALLAVAWACCKSGVDYKRRERGRK